MHAPIPILRMFDVEATKRFYLEYLGCQLDWQEGDGDRPVFMQVSRSPLVLNLSSHHGDGSPEQRSLLSLTTSTLSRPS